MDTEAARADLVKAARPDPRYLVLAKLEVELLYPETYESAFGSQKNRETESCENRVGMLKTPKATARQILSPGANRGEPHWSLQVNNGDNSPFTTH